MAEKYEDGEFWLPAEFLDEDFFIKESSAAEGRGGQPPCVGDVMPESESEEEDYIAGLTRQMARSFLGDEKGSSVSNSMLKVMATSPQSTLSDAGIWSASSRGSPNGPSQVSSPPSSPLEQRKDDAWDLLYAAAGEVGRMKQSELSVNGRGLLIPPKKPSTNSNIPAVSSAAYSNYTPVLTPQQLQAAQFYQLKHHQMIKQQVSATWSRQNRPARNNRSLGSTSAPVWPLQRHQPGSGMRAVFLNSSGTRRESAGTGVFLPRRVGAQNELRKKPACSSVLLPARVVQALNLNLQDTEINPRYPGYYSFGHDIASIRGNTSVSLQKPHHHRRLPPPFVAGHDVHLPPEWTY